MLEVLYHRTKFDGARISPSARATKNVEFLSVVCLSVCLFVCLSVTASRLGISEFVRTISCVLWISILPVVNNRLRG